MMIYYVDSSVLLRIIVDKSHAADAWFNAADLRGDDFIASRLLEVEVRHVADNTGGDQSTVNQYLDNFTLLNIDNDLASEAVLIPGPIGGADSIHVASAVRARRLVPLILITHDKQMAVAAAKLGIDVRDPVTDDPKRPTVAPPP